MFEVVWILGGDSNLGKTFTVYSVENTPEYGPRFLVFKDGMWVFESSSYFAPLKNN